MNDIKPRIDFFRELNTQTIYKIKDDLLKHSKGSIATYNEIVNDYMEFIFRQAGIDQYITFKETEKEFLNYKVDELALLDRGDILHFKEFEIYDRKLLFDFITIEPNSIKVFQLKISCKYEEETERINVYAFGAFMFKEACKMTIALLMEQNQAVPEIIEPSPFKNNIDNVPESKVIEYFTKNLVDKKYLSKEALESYLKQAFELKTPPAEKFSFENLPTQRKIIKVFYDYFKTTAGKPSGQKIKYVKLLGEYFNGFNTSKIESNFSK